MLLNFPVEYIEKLNEIQVQYSYDVQVIEITPKEWGDFDHF